MTTWIEVFKKNFTDKEILNPGFSIVIFNGRRYCKLCDGYFTESVDQHLAVHAQELEEFNNRRKIETEQKRKDAREKAKQQREAEHVSEPPKADEPKPTPTVISSEFYDTPCSVCGKGIKRSGKRGRPPTKHEGCK